MSRRAVVISLAVHGIALALIGARAVAFVPVALETPAVGPRPMAVEIDDVVAVAFLPEEAPIATATVIAAGSAAPTRLSSTSGGGGHASVELPVPEPGSGSGSGSGSNYMKMRGPDLGLPNTMVETFLANDKPAAHVEESGRIHQSGRIYRVPDLQVPATIGEDGVVTFHDKPATDIHWRIHLPSAAALGDALALWYADPYAQTQGRPVQELSKVDQAVDGGWDSGTGTGEGNAPISLHDKAYSKFGEPQLPIAGGSMDLTSWAMRKFHVGDPYASRKRKILAETFDQRVDIRARHTEHALDRSSELMQHNVARLWAGALSLADKKAALFELWDECTEGADHAGEAGERARAIVLSFIRSHAALTPAEVAAFDEHRASKQHFAPY